MADVENTLQGNWVLVGGNPNVIHRFWFENDSGGIEETQKEGDEYLVVDDHTIIKIIKDKSGFLIEITHLYGSKTYTISLLNKEKLIFSNNEVTIEYLKVKD